MLIKPKNKDELIELTLKTFTNISDKRIAPNGLKITDPNKLLSALGKAWKNDLNTPEDFGKAAAFLKLYELIGNVPDAKGAILSILTPYDGMQKPEYLSSDAEIDANVDYRSNFLENKDIKKYVGLGSSIEINEYLSIKLKKLDILLDNNHEYQAIRPTLISVVGEEGKILFATSDMRESLIKRTPEDAHK